MGQRGGDRGHVGGRTAVPDLPPVEGAPDGRASGQPGCGGGGGGGGSGRPGDAVGGGGGGREAVGDGAAAGEGERGEKKSLNFSTKFKWLSSIGMSVNDVNLCIDL